MKSKTKLISIILLVALASCAVTYAVMVAFRTLTTTITIVPIYDIELYDTDQITILTAVDFGVLSRGEAITLPATDRFYIKNTGDGDVWMKLETVDWPADVTLKINYVDDVGGFVEMNVLPGEITTNPIAPEAFQAFYFYIEVSETAVFDTYNPTFTLSAHDTASG